MISVVRLKAATLPGPPHWEFEIAAAEDLTAPERSFDLAVIGNAFHRLRRAAVAERVLRWLRPGGHPALLWGGSPTDGDATLSSRLA